MKYEMWHSVLSISQHWVSLFFQARQNNIQTTLWGCVLRACIPIIKNNTSYIKCLYFIRASSWENSSQTRKQWKQSIWSGWLIGMDCLNGNAFNKSLCAHQLIAQCKNPMSMFLWWKHLSLESVICVSQLSHSIAACCTSTLPPHQDKSLKVNYRRSCCQSNLG